MVSFHHLLWVERLGRRPSRLTRVSSHPAHVCMWHEPFRPQESISKDSRHTCIWRKLDEAMFVIRTLMTLEGLSSI